MGRLSGRLPLSAGDAKMVLHTQASYSRTLECFLKDLGLTGVYLSER